MFFEELEIGRVGEKRFVRKACAFDLHGKGVDGGDLALLLLRKS